ncbi:hypothetical protein NKR23_g7885 [Pleurostoma richardsiae]|uniref:Uncharacterized protein n=1 Tax=Pleurostoma richardsiae TaxID=41990 RepID=A0AA38VGD2_9PEZI|nr:hypothetical protein NKR23_g7885 [Pleurostoma richardsiae]
MEPSPREVSPETAAVDARFLQSVEKFRSRFFRQQEIATAAYEEEQAADRREEAAVQAQLQSIQQRLQRRQLAFEAAARELREKIRETIDIIDLCANDVSTDPQDAPDTPYRRKPAGGGDAGASAAGAPAQDEGVVASSVGSEAAATAGLSEAQASASGVTAASQRPSRGKRRLEQATTSAEQGNVDNFPRRTMRTRTRTRKADDGHGSASPTAEESEASRVPGKTPRKGRSIEYDKVYNGEHKHMIVEFPRDSGQWYILRCDKHMHFGRGPLKGAVQHLKIPQHGRLGATYEEAIKLLGVRVLNCNSEMADRNNQAFLNALDEGYTPFRAGDVVAKVQSGRNPSPARPVQPQDKVPRGNNVSDVWPGTETGRQRQNSPAFEGVTDPAVGEIYRTFCKITSTWQAAVRLPTGDFDVVGMSGSLADPGLARYIPVCYRSQGRKLFGWADGYEDGGPDITKRKFPFMCLSDDMDIPPRGDMEPPNSLSWIKAASLRPFSFDDPVCQRVRGYKAAQKFYARLKAVGERQVPHRAAPNAGVRGTGERRLPSVASVRSIASPNSYDFSTNEDDVNSIPEPQKPVQAATKVPDADLRRRRKPHEAGERFQRPRL